MRTRAFTSGLGLGRVLFNDLYRYTFFFFFFSLHGIDAQRGRSFSSSAIKNSSGARPPLSSRLQVTHARCIFFYAVVIAVERSRRVCARSFRRVEKKRREGGRGRGRKKKRKNSRALYTHDAPFLVARRGQNAPRRPNYYPRRVLAIVRGTISENSRYPMISARKKYFSPLRGMGGEEERERGIIPFRMHPLGPRSSFIDTVNQVRSA